MTNLEGANKNGKPAVWNDARRPFRSQVPQSHGAYPGSAHAADTVETKTQARAARADCSATLAGGCGAHTASSCSRKTLLERTSITSTIECHSRKSCPAC